MKLQQLINVIEHLNKAGFGDISVKLDLSADIDTEGIKVTLCGSQAEDLINELQKRVPASPLKESRHNWKCPWCKQIIPYDMLTQSPQEAPLFCCRCGQKYDWGNAIK